MLTEEPSMHKLSNNISQFNNLALCISVAASATLCLGVHAVQPPGSGHEQTDITWQMGPRPSLRVVSGNLVYEEQLLDGGLRTRFWSPNGLIKPDADLESGSPDGELPSLDEPIACSFGLSVDGQELWDGWKWKSAQKVPCNRAGCRHVVVELESTIRPIRVRVHTETDGHPFLKRWL